MLKKKSLSLFLSLIFFFILGYDIKETKAFDQNAVIVKSARIPSMEIMSASNTQLVITVDPNGNHPSNLKISAILKDSASNDTINITGTSSYNDEKGPNSNGSQYSIPFVAPHSGGWYVESVTIHDPVVGTYSYSKGEFETYTTTIFDSKTQSPIRIKYFRVVSENLDFSAGEVQCNNFDFNIYNVNSTDTPIPVNGTINLVDINNSNNTIQFRIENSRAIYPVMKSFKSNGRYIITHILLDDSNKNQVCYASPGYEAPLSEVINEKGYFENCIINVINVPSTTPSTNNTDTQSTDNKNQTTSNDTNSKDTDNKKSDSTIKSKDNTSTESNKSASADDSSNNSSSTMPIIGFIFIAFGVLVAIGLITGGYFYFKKNKK